MFKQQHIKIAIGLALGFFIGFVCNVGKIPSPAPPVLSGAALVLALTLGWILTDRWFATRPKRNEAFCAGPTGCPWFTENANEPARTSVPITTEEPLP